MTGYIGIGGKAKKVKNIYVGVGGVAKKVKKGYIGVNGVAKLWYSSAVEITYTGNYTDELVTMGGAPYRLLTLTSSGTLTAAEAVTGDIWICGGGGNGTTATGRRSGHGGGGGYANSVSNKNISSLTITIGAAGGATSVSGNVSLSADSVNSTYPNNGGTGGGGGFYFNGSWPPGTGDGNSKIPFGANDYFTYPYCDGGGAGGYGTSSNGGVGGTNGSDGGNFTSGSGLGGAGGGHYGGAGGSSSSPIGDDATGYGSGGGGTWNSNQAYYTDNFAKGYQGVCFIRIPL